MRRLATFLSLCLLLSPVGAKQYQHGRHKAPQRHRAKMDKTLTATWYQKDGALVAWHYHGRPGTRMEPGCLTAAHRTLPFGHILKVRRGKYEVVVTVTDRGPEPWTGSDLDLSREAASRLGMLRLGRAKVVVEH